MQDGIVILGIIVLAAPIVIAAGLLRNAVRRTIFGLIWRPLDRLRDSDDDTPMSAIFLERYQGDISDGIDRIPLDDIGLSTEDMPAKNGSFGATRTLRRLLWGVRAPSSAATSSNNSNQRQ